jgi:hypothetical protein
MGMAIWIIIGGLLNLLNIAYGFALDIVVVAGLVYSIWLFHSIDHKGIITSIRDVSKWPGNTWTGIVAGIFILGVFVFNATTQVPPQAYNFHDDLEKYFAYPVRMLATGNLHGGPFNALGSNAVGGQAFLHGFISAHWHIKYINAVDALFSFSLCQLIILGTSLKMRLPNWLTIMSVAITIFISPQYVNVSSLYTASTLVALLILGPSIMETPRNDNDLIIPIGIVTGTLYSALVVLKPTLFIFVAVHFSLILIFLLFVRRPLKLLLSFLFSCAFTSGLSVLPWLLVHRKHWKNLLTGVSNIDDSLLAQQIESLPAPEINLFSLGPLFFGHGSRPMHYSGTMIIVVLCFLIVLFILLKNRLAGKINYVFPIVGEISAVLSFAIAIYVTADRVSGPVQGLRYMCPIIIAAVPSAFLTAGNAIAQWKKAILPPKMFLNISGTVLAICLIGILVSFSGSLVTRARQAIYYGSILSFEKAKDSRYLLYNRMVLDGSYKEKIREIQKLVPRGEALVAWIGTPYLLDFKRNEILDVQPAAFASPWFEFPLGPTLSKTVESGYKYFDQEGISYILWEYNGYATRSIQQLVNEASLPFNGTRKVSIRSIAFTKMIDAIVKRSQVLYDDNEIILIKIHGSD